MMRRENFFRRTTLCFLVMLERSGHRTTSPRVWCEKLVRAASVDDAPWSQPSLRSRSGMGISQARPLLSRLFPAPLIPARPFGLGWRFDEARLVAPSCLSSASRQPYQTDPRSAARVAHLRIERKPAQADTHLMAGTTQIGPGRSLSGPVPQSGMRPCSMTKRYRSDGTRYDAGEGNSG